MSLSLTASIDPRHRTKGSPGEIGCWYRSWTSQRAANYQGAVGSPGILRSQSHAHWPVLGFAAGAVDGTGSWHLLKITIPNWARRRRTQELRVFGTRRLLVMTTRPRLARMYDIVAAR